MMAGVQKRKIRWVISSLLVTLYFYGLPAQAQYGGGSGEPNDPYLIYTAEQMNAIGAEPNDWDKHFKLMADIDLASYSYDTALIAPDTDSSKSGFQGTPFTGVFDGNGLTISNLTIEGVGYLGLFGQLEPTALVKNLGLEAVDVSGSGRHIGGLVGHNYGHVTQCYTSGSVNGSGQDVGGIVGINNGVVSLCCSTSTVSGDVDIGGLVGLNFVGSIANSYSTGFVRGDRSVGGLVGSNVEGDVSQCYSTGSVSGENSVGGLVGHRWGWDAVRACFWDIETSGQTISAGGIGKTTAEMQTASTFLEAGWDFVDETENGTEDIWRILEGLDYPRLWWQPEVDVVEQVSLPLRGESGEMILGLGTLEAAVYSPDGKYIATAGSLGVFLWDAETGALLRTLIGHTRAINSVAFSPDGTRVLTGSTNKTATLWDAETGQEIRTFLVPTSDVTSMAFSPDGTRVLTGSSDGTARIWVLVQPEPSQPPAPF